MTVLSAQTIRRLNMISPHYERSVIRGRSFGLSSCGYDVRVDQTMTILPGRFELASTMEHFSMPVHVMGRVHDKSTWARLGLAVQNTVIEPGWRGWLTLELTNHSNVPIFIQAGDPIAQIVFDCLDEPTDQPYPERGKYMDQPPEPVPARMET
jgi:dCTP deaminase